MIQVVFVSPVQKIFEDLLTSCAAIWQVFKEIIFSETFSQKNCNGRVVNCAQFFFLNVTCCAEDRQMP